MQIYADLCRFMQICTGSEPASSSGDGSLPLVLLMGLLAAVLIKRIINPSF